MAVTIRNIAEKAKVSVTTVSQILNGKGERFSPRTRDRVQKIAANLNYTPNRLAASLATGTTKTLGVIVPDIRNPFFGALAHGIDERATELGWSIYLSNSSDSHLKEMQIISTMIAQQVDGILYCMAGETDERSFGECCRQLIESSIPFILMDRYFALTDTATIITLDHRRGGYLATQHLIELGHQNIACITGPLNLVDARMRVAGYRDALEDAGLPVQDEFILEGNYHQDSGYANALALLQADQTVTAVFASNDLMAIGVMDAIAQMGLCTPDDVSVVGYDDVISTYFQNSSLTSVYQPVENLGRLAAERVIERMGVTVNKIEVDLEPVLRVRTSTAAPKVINTK